MKSREGHEPIPQSGEPDMPVSLPADAREVWRQLCGILSETNVLTVADGASLERYCRYIIDWRACQDALDAFGGKGGRAGGYANGDTRPVLKGLRAERRELETFLRHIETHFGLTPAARARISIPTRDGSPNTDPMKELLEPGVN